MNEKRISMTAPALALGLCPAVCAAVSGLGGLVIGLATVLVFALSEWVVSLLKAVLPESGRLPVLLAAAAGLSALVTLLAEALLPDVYGAAGPYLPLTAVSCLLLDRVPALKRTDSAVKTGGLFVLALTAVGLVCEFLGAGTLFGAAVLPESLTPAAALAKVPGAFLLLAFVLMGASALNGEEGSK